MSVRELLNNKIHYIKMRRTLKCCACLILLSVLVFYNKYKYLSYNRVVLVWNGTKNTELKYILQWTSPHNVPFVYMGVGRKVFFERDCSYTNCYVTSNRNFFANYTMFDAVVFAGPEIIYYWQNRKPLYRSSQQKYVFASIESPAYYHICTSLYEGYFNWTWSYKLDSDLRWGYMVVRDSKRNIVGPNKEMRWMRHEDMEPVSEDLKKTIRGKTKAAAWFVSNCNSLSNRGDVALMLNQELKRYNLSIDIYGKCGSKRCDRKNETFCNELIRRDYFFYLSFENALSEDYVTEKLLRALQNNAVPIVYGGANYSRFLPNRSYLNAREMSIENLAAKINELINDFPKYVEYFRWTNHYSYHKTDESAETDEYCQMCAILNNESKVKEISIYEHFSTWWNERFCKHV